MARSGPGRCGLGVKQGEKLSSTHPQRGRLSGLGPCWPLKGLAHTAILPHITARPHAASSLWLPQPGTRNSSWHRSGEANSTDPGAVVHRGLMLQERENRQVNAHLCGPKVGFTGAPLIFQSDLNLQEKMLGNKESQVLFVST